MWALVENNQIKKMFQRPKATLIGSVQHPKEIFTLWPKSKLKEHGILPYREVNIVDNMPDDTMPAGFDEKYYRTNAGTTTIYRDEVVKTFTKVLKPLPQLKQVKLEGLKQHRERVINSGIVYTNTANTSGVIQTDEKSRDNIQSAYLLSTVNQWANTHTWRTRSNQKLLMDSVDLKKMATIVGKRTALCFHLHGVHEDAIKALTSKNAVRNYDFTSSPSWPVMPPQII